MIFSGSFANARHEVDGRQSVGGTIAAVLAALIIPILIVLMGLIAYVLAPGLSTSPVVLGRRLSIPLPDSLLERTPTQQLMVLIAIAAVLAICLAGLLWRNQLGMLRRSRLVIEHFHRQILERSLVRAQREGASAQRARVQELIAHRLPVLRSGLVAWWRVVPRAVLVLVGCVVLGLLVDIWLALLAVICGLIVWRLYVWLADEETDRTVDWELARSQNHLVELVQKAPLLARLQSQAIVAEAFEAELQRMQRRHNYLDNRRSRVIPAVALAALLGICLFLLALGVNRFSTTDALGLPAAVVLGLALSAVAVSALRIGQTVYRTRAAADAATQIYRFLSNDQDTDPGERLGISGLRESVDLDNVTLTNDAGREILSSLTLRLQPRSLVAVMGTDPVSTSALIELLLGFGQPCGGGIAIDGLPIGEIHTNSLSRQVSWVGQDGPIWHGTVSENLLGNHAGGGEAAMQEALRRVGVYEKLSDLSDGLQTVLSPDDERLDSSTRYAIGVARALIRRPAIVVVEEPDTEESFDDDACLDALLFLAENGSLVIILPRRLRTLRAADRVILLNGSRLAGEGKHDHLLANSDLYRHLNYLLFNPYRNR